MIAEQVAFADLVLQFVPKSFETVPDAFVEVFQAFDPFLEFVQFGVVGFFEFGGKDDEMPFGLSALDDVALSTLISSGSKPSVMVNSCSR